MRDEIGEIVNLAPGEGGFIRGIRIDQNDSAQLRQPIEQGNERLRQRPSGDDRRGAAVAQNVGVLVGGEQRIERQRHDAGAHGAPERHRKIHRVVEQEAKPFLLTQAEIRQRRSERTTTRLQFAVGQRVLGIDEGKFFSKPARDLRVQQIRHGVVRPAL